MRICDKDVNTERYGLFSLLTEDSGGPLVYKEDLYKGHLLTISHMYIKFFDYVQSSLSSLTLFSFPFTLSSQYISCNFMVVVVLLFLLSNEFN